MKNQQYPNNVYKHSICLWRKWASFAIIFQVCVLTSCQKFVEVPLPKNRLASGLVFKDDNSATSAVVGIYSDMMQTSGKLMSTSLTWNPALEADELVINSTNVNYNQFYHNVLSSDHTEVLSDWTQGYSYIYDANAVIEGLQSSTSITNSVKNQLLGEAKFIRAFTYFYLTSLFGDVPLVNSTDYTVNATMQRTPQSQVYAFIINDLKDAKNLLTDTYPSAERGRPNKWTVSALLARVYLYTKDWTDAESEVTGIINTNIYSIVPVTSTFSKTSNETIWQLVPVSASANTWVATAFIPTTNTSIPAFSFTTDFINSFEAGDLRKINWVGISVASSGTYYYEFKYKIRTTSTTSSEDFIVLRLAEQYLIRAEARAMQNTNLTGAINDVNTIRARAGLSNLASNLSQSQIMTAIEKERRVELFGEWGHRWLDLNRTGRADAVLSALKPTYWKSTANLWPIPITQINLNSALTQNPGY